MSQKIVINRCWGGYGLSREAILRMRELGSEEANKVTFNVLESI